jgi:hypothetical protein
MARRPPEPPPADNDPALVRTCTRCHAARDWVVNPCPACRNPEFSITPVARVAHPAPRTEAQPCLF